MINTNFVVEALFKNIDKNKINQLNLKPGQIINGKVLDILNNGQALVSIKGFNIIAKSEVPLTKGQQSMFLVTSSTDDIKLKILNNNNSSNPSITTTKDILRYFDLKNNITNRQIVDNLFKENMPIDKVTIKNISYLVDEGYDLKNLIANTKILNDKKLPISQMNLKVVSEFFNEEGILNKLINLSDNINKNSNYNSNNSNINFNSFDNSSNDINKLIIKIQDQITRLINDFKVNFTNNNENNTNNSASNILDNRLDSKNILTKINKYMEEIQLKPFEKLQNESVSLKENLEQLYKFKDVLPKEVTNNLDKTLTHITGQHLLNQPDTSPINHTIIQFPNIVPFSDKPVYLQINNNKQEESNSINPNDVNLAFLFQLNNLGELIIKVKINENQLFIQFMNNNPLTKEIIKQFEPSFMQFLNEQGYKSSGFTFYPLVETKKINFTDNTTNYKGVDIRL